ncbi:efflux RND transporter periplasmic adaptor subunit [Paenibacillus sp. J2TS4]|uniref:efflux RND transporter periplasmic adaptor subunit n=1 Tax=Paenibacillus sp. J2TS4 TaxID=2807194 RepID=UPI001B2A9C9C|nr:efflux RND transporter periplasmic adaptor subunit [Paenibacillus sp. J2TS4]GIP35342.1 RND transporter [Paenibacillus sp. J2TS4]
MFGQTLSLNKRIPWLVILVLIIAGCSADPSGGNADEEKQTPVQVESVREGNMAINLEVTGTAQASQQISVVPRVSGTLEKLYVSKGQAVKQGEALAAVENRDLITALELEKAGLANAQTQLELARSRERQGLDASKNSLRDETAKEQAAENLKQAQLAVEQAEIGVQQASLRIKQAEQRLSDAVIHSPIDGEVLSIQNEVGEMIGQSPFLVIVSLDPIKVVANISPKQLPLFQQGQAVQLEVGGHPVTGTVEYVSPAAADSGLFTVEVTVANAERLVKPGMMAKLVIPQTLAENVLIVPTASIMEESGQSYVFVIREDKAVKMNVDIVQAQSDETAVQGELTAGDKVVTKGQFTLSDGGKVKVIGEGDVK